jgi:hypothetical protein
MAFIISKEDIEENLFGKDSENKITDYQYEHLKKYWNSKEAFDEYANNQTTWTKKNAIMDWFSWYGDRDDLETIQWTPFDLYAPTHPKLINKTINK